MRTRPSADAAPADRQTAGSVTLRLVNRGRRGHEVAVAVAAGGRRAFAATYYVGPGGMKSVPTPLTPTTYQVMASLDGATLAAAECRLGRGRGRTVEVIVSDDGVRVAGGPPPEVRRRG